MRILNLVHLLHLVHVIVVHLLTVHLRLAVIVLEILLELWDAIECYLGYVLAHLHYIRVELLLIILSFFFSHTQVFLHLARHLLCNSLRLLLYWLFLFLNLLIETI